LLKNITLGWEELFGGAKALSDKSDRSDRPDTLRGYSKMGYDYSYPGYNPPPSSTGVYIPPEEANKETVYVDKEGKPVTSNEEKAVAVFVTLNSKPSIVKAITSGTPVSEARFAFSDLVIFSVAGVAGYYLARRYLK
jgi:hypothetical protein